MPEMIPATSPTRKVNRTKNQNSLRLALPENVAYLLKHVEIALPILFLLYRFLQTQALYFDYSAFMALPVAFH